MKKRMKVLAAMSAAVVALSAVAAGCSQGNFVNGPEYSYRVTGKTEEYVINTTGSTVQVDSGITVDGVFDEALYEGRNWLQLNKIVPGGETGSLEMTTYFSDTGILVAAHIVDSRPAVYSSSVETGNQTCFSGYFAFEDATTVGNDVYEIECTAGNRFKISEFVNGSLRVLSIPEDQMPVHAVRRIGDITKGECYEYYVEYFMPYSLYGKSARPVKVYFNPTMISATLDDYGNAIADLRTWYNFGGEQSSLNGWGKPNSGYVFDRNGFICNDLIIEEAEGGTVTEEWGYDWTIDGDVVNLNIQPDEGYVLEHLYFNGEDVVSSVMGNVYSFTAYGDATVVPIFVPQSSAIQVENSVEAWVGYPPSEFVVKLNNGESDFTLEYDETKLEIDKENRTVRALAEGRFEVKVTSGEDTASFYVNASVVDTSGTQWNYSGFTSSATDRANQYAANGTDGKTTVFIGDSFFDVASWSWNNFYTDYAGKDALALGISSSTSFDWENFYLHDHAVLDMAPKNLVVNVGTNNFYDDHRSM